MIPKSRDLRAIPGVVSRSRGPLFKTGVGVDSGVAVPSLLEYYYIGGTLIEQQQSTLRPLSTASESEVCEWSFF